MRISAIFLLFALPVLGEIAAPPGRLIDVGGRKMHIHCTGSGSPTVILEAGASSFSLDWSLVQPEIAKSVRVCSYDRARMGWSDPGPMDTADNIVQDLRTLLRAANGKGPYVLVGASMGGIYVRVFQMRYPEDVVGMVLVDPTHELRLFTTIEGKAVPIPLVSAEQYRKVLPRGEVKIPRRQVQTGDPFTRLPASLYKTRVELDQRLIDSYPASVGPEIVAERAEAERATLAELNAARRKATHSLGSLPLVILTRGMNTDKERIAAYDELATMSTKSRHTVVADAGHEIHLYQPGAVIEAIREVIGLASSNGKADDGKAAKDAIRQQVTKYTAALDAADIDLASQVWRTSPDVSFIHPAGHARGWEEVKGIYKFFGASFSERKLTVRDVAIHVNGETAWAEFYWHFVAKQSKDGSVVQTDGRETQIYAKDGNGWRLVHVHYSGPAMTP